MMDDCQLVKGNVLMVWWQCRLAQLGSEAMLHMMLVDSFIHSDLHPGKLAGF